MTYFVHVDRPLVHPGVARLEAVAAKAVHWKNSFDGSRSLAALLLAAMVAALIVVADQMIETWADGHLLAAWVALWIVAFSAIALLAPATRHVAAYVIEALNGWSRRVASERADERLMALARKDPRVMADLCAARSKAD